MTIYNGQNRIIKRRVTIKQWLKNHRLHFLAAISTTLLIAAAWFMAFQWLQTEMLKIQFPEAEMQIVKRAKAAEVKTEAPNVAQIVDGIYFLESTSGKNDGCARDGKGYNGYGYRQNKREFKCFKSRAEVKGYVTGWVQEKLDAGWSVPKALCYYNTGYKVDDCKYYKDYLSI